MTRHNSSGGNSLPVVIAFGFILVCFAVYSVLKSWADTLGLDVYSVFCLVIGLGAVGGIAASLTSVFGASLRGVLPWMIPVYSLCTFPALNYRAQLGAGPFGVEIYDLAWYGTMWGKVLIVLVCCLIAYGIMKWLDN